MKKVDYHEYLQSEGWKVRRQWKLEAAGDRCQLCDATHHLQVHHRTYERLGNERISDLIVLCEGCHRKFHDIFEEPAQRTSATVQPSDPVPVGLRLGAERNIVLCVLRDDSWLGTLTSRLSPESFRSPVYAEIIAALVGRSADRDGEAWTEALSSDAALAVQDLMGDPEWTTVTHPARFFEENIRDIERREGLVRQVSLLEAKHALRRRLEGR